MVEYVCLNFITPNLFQNKFPEPVIKCTGLYLHNMLTTYVRVISLHWLLIQPFIFLFLDAVYIQWWIQICWQFRLLYVSLFQHHLSYITLVLSCIQCVYPTPTESSKISSCKDRHKASSVTGDHNAKSLVQREGEPRSFGKVWNYEMSLTDQIWIPHTDIIQKKYSSTAELEWAVKGVLTILRKIF